MGALCRVYVYVSVLLLCCTMLSMAVDPAPVAAVKKVGERQLEFRDANYTVWAKENVAYISSTSYHAKGMAPLYKIANQVLQMFVGENAIPEGRFFFAFLCIIAALNSFCFSYVYMICVYRQIL